MAEQLAAHEDAIDRVRELVEELCIDVGDGVHIELHEVVERLGSALAEVEGMLIGQ